MLASDLAVLGSKVGGMVIGKNGTNGIKKIASKIASGGKKTVGKLASGGKKTISKIASTVPAVGTVINGIKVGLVEKASKYSGKVGKSAKKIGSGMKKASGGAK